MTTYDKVNVQEKFLTNLLTKIEQAAKEGKQLPWVKPWKSNPGACYSFNMETGKFYNGYNAIMFPAGGYLTYKQIKKYDLWVPLDKIKCYETGIYYNFVATKATQHLPENEQVMFPMIKTFQVYNFELLDEKSKAKALKLFNSLKENYLQEKLQEIKPIESVDEVINKYSKNLKGGLNHGGDKACYIPSRDEVRIPNINQFKTREDYYSTLFHELIHSTGNKERLNRDMNGIFGSVNYAIEELIAEMGACLACCKLQIDYSGGHINNDSNSVAYILNWLSVLKNDVKLLKPCISASKKACEFILK